MSESKKYLYDIDLSNEHHASTKVLRLVGRGTRVLEVGCASGAQSRIMKEQLGCVITGIEVDPDAAQSARRYCDQVIIGNIEQLNLDALLPGVKYDHVIFADVLEHLINPCEALRKVWPLLADDGYVIASIPNIAHSSVILDLAHGKFDYKPYGLLDNTHIRFFTKKTVYTAFEEAGYLIASLDRISGAERDTEFRQVELTRAERTILRFVQNNNPESDTFQFIVKAYKAVGAAEPKSSHVMALEERVQELERQLMQKAEALLAKDADVRSLTEQLRWTVAGELHRVVLRLKKLLGVQSPNNKQRRISDGG
jgi:2-polyprenyl-3-methyl-5-hydroxy-6-metoxy-1,4-benzoquinol methylase